MTTMQLRIPRGLWTDLEEAVIQQDRQFLIEVARSLGLPAADVIRRCLGTRGDTAPIPILWTPPQTDAPTACPYWECFGDGLWRRCPRLRLSDSLPCLCHERTSTGTPRTRLNNDPALQELPWVLPVRDGDELYWVDPTGVAPPYTEDGTVCADRQYKRARNRDGDTIWLRVRTTT